MKIILVMANYIYAKNCNRQERWAPVIGPSACNQKKVPPITSPPGYKPPFTILDKIDGKFVRLPPSQGLENGAFWILRGFILDLKLFGVCCSILICLRL